MLGCTNLSFDWPSLASIGTIAMRGVLFVTIETFGDLSDRIISQVNDK